MPLQLIGNYLMWHYTTAWRDLFHIWRNLVWFVIHFFSIPQLARALFAPWKRMTEQRREWSFEAIGEMIIVNLMSRIIGALLRGTVILIGVVCLLCLLVGGVAGVLLWVVAPGVVLGAIITGMNQLIQ